MGSHTLFPQCMLSLVQPPLYHTLANQVVICDLPTPDIHNPTKQYSINAVRSFMDNYFICQKQNNNNNNQDDGHNMDNVQ